MESKIYFIDIQRELISRSIENYEENLILDDHGSFPFNFAVINNNKILRQHALLITVIKLIEIFSLNFKLRSA